jgi:hypothetical protein
MILERAPITPVALYPSIPKDFMSPPGPVMVYPFRSTITSLQVILTNRRYPCCESEVIMQYVLPRSRYSEGSAGDDGRRSRVSGYGGNGGGSGFFHDVTSGFKENVYDNVGGGKHWRMIDGCARSFGAKLKPDFIFRPGRIPVLNSRAVDRCFSTALQLLAREVDRVKLRAPERKRFPRPEIAVFFNGLFTSFSDALHFVVPVHVSSWLVSRASNHPGGI